MRFLVKTEPRLQSVIKKKDYNIVAVSGCISDIELSLNDKEINFLFYFEFHKEDGQVVDTANATRYDVVYKTKSKLKLENPNLTDEELLVMANIQVDTLIKAILGGTKAHRYGAMTAMAAGYGLVLLPLANQDGIITPPITE